MLYVWYCPELEEIRIFSFDRLYYDSLCVGCEECQTVTCYDLNNKQTTWYYIGEFN